MCSYGEDEITAMILGGSQASMVVSTIADIARTVVLLRWPLPITRRYKPQPGDDWGKSEF